MSHLNEKVLIISKDYIPINFTTVARAIGKLFSGNVEVITVDATGTYNSYDLDHWITVQSDDFIPAVNINFPVPRVIRVLRYIRYNKRTGVRFSRHNIYKRDNYTCAFCGKEFVESKLSVEHIIPISRGGETRSWDNVVTACKKCNNQKGNKLLSEVNMKLLFQPYKPKYNLFDEIDKIYPEWEYFR
jgi:5-methylcytosine-specific restriction endonuclease McrA